MASSGAISPGILTTNLKQYIHTVNRIKFCLGMYCTVHYVIPQKQYLQWLEPPSWSNILSPHTVNRIKFFVGMYTMPSPRTISLVARTNILIQYLHTVNRTKFVLGISSGSNHHPKTKYTHCKPNQILRRNMLCHPQEQYLQWMEPPSWNNIHTL
jgi:hypothetical protein